MSDRRAYSFTVLRYVHDVVGGEALNVGVVLHAPAHGFLQARTRKSAGRIRKAFPDLDISEFRAAMAAIDRGLRAVAKSSAGEPLLEEHTDARRHAIKALPDDDSALQWSPLGTGLTADPEATLARLYQRYVLRYDRSPGEQRRSDEEIWRIVRNKLNERNVTIPFEPKLIAGKQDEIEFGKAWKNGCWHAYEPVSLDLADADGIKDKARRWRGHLSAVAEGVSEAVDLHFVLGRPQAPELMDAYETAKHILAGAEFAREVVDEIDVDDLVSALEDEYRAHLAAAER